MVLIDKLITRLGIIFNDTQRLQGALMHRSYRNEHPDRAHGMADSERLEFLGDSVLNYVAADLLFRRFPAYTEGELTKLRAVLIRTGTLAGFARDLELGSYVLLGRGEKANHAAERDNMLADTFEALLAAMYLDRGLEVVRTFLTPFFEQQLALIESGVDVDAGDYKTQLLAYVQKHFGITPLYRTVGLEGPEHQREVTAEVLRAGEAIGSGRGPSKQAAEQAAAREALLRLTEGG